MTATTPTTVISPQDTVERALSLSTADGCVVRVVESTSANLRWAGNTLTTNGEMRSRTVAVTSVVNGTAGTAAAVVQRSAATADVLADVVQAADRAARDAGPADDAAPLVEPSSGQQGGAGWDAGPATTSIGVFGSLAPALGECFRQAKAADQLLFGFAEHSMTSTYLGSSTGLRLRHDQPTGRLECNAKSSDFASSVWSGTSTRDFTDVDVAGVTAELATRLGWAQRRIELPPGRYQTILPPSAVADLVLDLYMACTARDADEGRTVFSRSGGGSRIGDRLTDLPLNLRSDPAEPGLECTPFLHTLSHWIPDISAFDHGMPCGRVDWIGDGVLGALIRNRNWAARTGASPVPYQDNLVLEATGASAGMDELVAGTDRGLLLTTVWYTRLVDPQTLLLTGLTRDGVYLVEDGDVVGAVNNFRFNESPVSLLGRVTEVSRTERCLPREFGDYFTNTAMPALRIPDFNMSTTSKAA